MKNRLARIAILGCGWLGLPLAQRLITLGHRVKGSTTTEAKINLLAGTDIKGFLIHLKETSITGDITSFLKETDVLIINVPPGLRKSPNKDHYAEIKQLIEPLEASAVTNVIFISSTSVFENTINLPVIGDNDAPNGRSATAKQLYAIEQMLQQSSSFKTSIIRFGGLIDDDRHPGHFLAGRTGISDPEGPINLIHKTDAIQIISSLIHREIWNTTLNAVYPLHSKRFDYYTAYCKNHQLDLPQFDFSRPSKGKIIESSNLVRLLNYDFQIKP